MYFPHLYQLDVHKGALYSGNMWYLEQWTKYRRMEVEKQEPVTIMPGDFGASSEYPENLTYIGHILEMMDTLAQDGLTGNMDQEEASVLLIHSAFPQA